MPRFVRVGLSTLPSLILFHPARRALDVCHRILLIAAHRFEGCDQVLRNILARKRIHLRVFFDSLQKGFDCGGGGCGGRGVFHGFKVLHSPHFRKVFFMFFNMGLPMFRCDLEKVSRTIFVPSAKNSTSPIFRKMQSVHWPHTEGGGSPHSPLPHNPFQTTPPISKNRAMTIPK